MSANSTIVPPDILQWFDSLGLHRRVIALNKNMVNGFVDGLLVADIISCRFPRMIQLHNYLETSSATGRYANWELLNKKVLNEINCELGEEDIEMIANRKVQRVAITTFLRLLRTKLEIHAPIYHAEQQQLAAEQKKQKEKLTLQAFEKRAKQDQIAKQKLVESAVPTSSVYGSENSSRRPSLARSKKILEVPEDKKALREYARTLTENDVDKMYGQMQQISNERANKNQHLIDKMDERSREISNAMAQLRAQNLEDIKKIESRLATLHSNSDSKTLDNNDSIPFIDNNPISALEVTVDEISGAKSLIGVGRRSSAISAKLISMIPEGRIASAKPNKELEKQITRRSSVILQKVLKMPNSVNISSLSLDDEEVSESECVKDKNDSDGTVQVSDVFGFGNDNSPKKNMKMKEETNEVSHRRVYDGQRERHFYVDIISGESSWVPPKKGIINCIDENTGRTFYTNAQTKASGWTIEQIA